MNTMAKTNAHVDEIFDIGYSPFEGVTLKQTVETAEPCTNLAWSPDGRILACLSTNKITFYDHAENTVIKEIAKLKNERHALAWSPDGSLVAFSEGNYIHLIDAAGDQLVSVLKRHEKWINDLFFYDNKTLVSSSGDGTVRLWNLNTYDQVGLFGPFETPTSTIFRSEDYNTIGIRVINKGILFLHKKNYGWQRTKMIGFPEIGVKKNDHCIAYKNQIAIGDGNVIRIVGIDSNSVVTLEGHTDHVCGVSFYGERILISKSLDDTLKLWDCDTWSLLGTISENSPRVIPTSVLANPNGPFFVSYGKMNHQLRVWKIDEQKLFAQPDMDNSFRYAAAKLVLVGDSGVGKTGLGWRLAHDQYKEHDSTHGQQFWLVDELGITNNNGTVCEAVLWDLAGQPDYRLVHSLYLDNVNLALVVFDPTKRQDSLHAPLFWIRQLKKEKNVTCPIILVGARSDTGTSTLTDEEIKLFCEKNNILGGFLLTSAKKNVMIYELKEKIKKLIPWDSLNTTITNNNFKKVKDYVLRIKEDADRKSVLVTPENLRRELEASDPGLQFTDKEMIATIQNLENHGYVNILHNSKGEIYFLLRPDILTNLASSFVLEARRNHRGLGVLEEEKIYSSAYHFIEVASLSSLEREILLDTTILLFIKHAICFRTSFNSAPLLIFPSLINEKRPLIDEVEVFEDVSYKVSGPVENVYASLVVLLGYTNIFVRSNQWQNQAQYQVSEGELCGFKQISNIENEIEFVLYYSANVLAHNKSLFQGLFERFLSKRELTIHKYVPVSCDNCREPLDRNVMMLQISKQRFFSHCNNCGAKLKLPNYQIIGTRNEPGEALKEQQDIVLRRTAYEVALVKIKGLLREEKTAQPASCFISYSWGNQSDEEWVLRFAKDIKNANINVLLDKWSNPPGTRISSYIESIHSADFAIVIGTPLLKGKYTQNVVDTVITAELSLINNRLIKPIRHGHAVIPVLLRGNKETSFTPLIQDVVHIDFRDEAYYFYNLLSLIWRLNQLPFDSPVYADLRDSLKPAASSGAGNLYGAV